MGAPADARRRLENRDAVSRIDQRMGRSETSRAGADDGNVDISRGGARQQVPPVWQML
jgi:hypothetical protein